MKKKVLVLSLVIALIATITFGTIAWFSASDSTRNTITAEFLGISVTEVDGQNQPWVNPEEPVAPGAELDYTAAVEYNANIEAFIRVKVTPSFDSEDLGLSVIDVNYNTADWTCGDDGYWYYHTAVKGEGATEPLFEGFAFSEEAGNDYQGATFTISVEAEAIQAANGAPQAAGWMLP